MKLDASKAWYGCLHDVMYSGALVSPRGKHTLELLHHTIMVDMQRPVVVCPERKLGYRFMAAEALWILSGDDRVSTIAPYNSNIAQFSDDGETFAGAYGPQILGQLNYVVQKLREDHNTRQAGLTIWKPNPAPSKDIPCTVAVWFTIRDDLLNCHVFMRSNDVWLGTPYDVFNASMLSYTVCAMLLDWGIIVSPGTLYHTAASRHVYAENDLTARTILNADFVHEGERAPSDMWRSYRILTETLKSIRDVGVYGNPLAWWRS